MLSVNLLAEETDLESVREQFRQNASSTEIREARRLFEILLPVDEEEVSLTNEQEEYVNRMQEETELFFYEDSDAVGQVNEMRLFCMSNQTLATKIRTMIAYIVDMENISLDEAREAKEKLNEINSDMEFDFTIPSP